MTASITDMPARERPISEQYRIVAKQYVEAKKQSRFMEKTRTAMRNRMIAKMIATSNEKLTKAQAEFKVMCSDEWMQYNQDLVDAEERTDILYAQKEYLKQVFWEQTDANANARQERKQLR